MSRRRPKTFGIETRTERPRRVRIHLPSRDLETRTPLSSPRNRGKELPSTGSRDTKRAGHE